MEGEFGAGYAPVLAGELVISEYQLTAQQALRAGVEPRRVWEALCRQQDVPEERLLGADVPLKRD